MFNSESITPSVLDTGLKINFTTKALIYREQNNFTIVICDEIGTIINVMQFEKSSIDSTYVDDVEIEENKIYLVNITFYDIFFKVNKILNVIEIENSINQYFKEGIKIDKDFVRIIFNECKNNSIANQLN